MKIVVKKEHLERALAACKEWREKGGDGPGYNSCCLIAQAARDAGLDVIVVTAHSIYAKGSEEQVYVLPSNVTDVIRRFDRYEGRENGGGKELLGELPPPPVDFEFEAPLYKPKN